MTARPPVRHLPVRHLPARHLPARHLPAWRPPAAVAATAAMVVTALALPVPGARADDPPLIPHQAVFDLALADGAAPGAVQWADGRLLYRQELTCDRWLVASGMQITTGLADGSTVRVATDHQVTEAIDGRRLEFRVTQSLGDNGMTLTGLAVRQPDGSLEAQFREPDPVTITLPPDTLFPQALTRAVVDAATAGARQHSALMFDGTVPMAMQVASFISDPRTGRPFPLDSSGAVADIPSWRLRVATYDPAAAGPDPLSEFGMVLYANGVTRDLSLDVSGLTLRGRLVSYERLPDPDC